LSIALIKWHLRWRISSAK